MRHSLRYYRHSGLVIYISKLPAPSVSMPCDYRILQSPTKVQVLLVLLETAQAVSLDDTLLKHRISNLEEASDIRTLHIIDIAIFTTILQALLVDVAHNLM